MKSRGQPRGASKKNISGTDRLYKRTKNHLRIIIFIIEKMNRDEIIDLAMANMLDIIPLISNIENEVNADINTTLVLIYERNMAMLNLL